MCNKRDVEMLHTVESNIKSKHHKSTGNLIWEKSAWFRKIVIL